MTTRTHQINTQSGTAKIRSGSRSKTRTASAGGGARQSSRGKRRKSEKSNKGARVLLMMVVIGGVIGAIFILAQKLQVNTLHLKRAEEGLKSEIDTYASQQRYLIYQKEKALSTQEAQRAASEFGLVQPGVGRTVAAQTEPETKSAAKPVAAKSVAKQSVQLKQPGKLAKNAKAATLNKPINVKKSGGQTTPKMAVKTPAAKKTEVKKPAAKNQVSRKEVRR